VLKKAKAPPAPPPLIGPEEREIRELSAARLDELTARWRALSTEDRKALIDRYERMVGPPAEGEDRRRRVERRMGWCLTQLDRADDAPAVEPDSPVGGRRVHRSRPVP
jgi:hypothetical protein